MNVKILHNFPKRKIFAWNLANIKRYYATVFVLALKNQMDWIMYENFKRKLQGIQFIGKWYRNTSSLVTLKYIQILFVSGMSVKPSHASEKTTDLSLFKWEIKLMCYQWKHKQTGYKTSYQLLNISDHLHHELIT